MEEAVRQLAAMDGMSGSKVAKLLDQVDKWSLVSALVYISGYSPEAFRAGLQYVERFELEGLAASSATVE